MSARRITAAAVGRGFWASLAGSLLVIACSRGGDGPDETTTPAPAAASASSSAGNSSAKRAALNPELAEQVLARVGDRVITLGDFQAALERMDRFERLRYQTADRRRHLLDELIDLELLAREAERRGLDKAPETQALLRQLLRDTALEELRQKLPDADQIPADEVRKYFEAHPDEFADPERRRVSVIAMRSREAALQLLDAARKATPEQWGELVGKHSLKGRKPGGLRAESTAPPLELAGDLGFVSAPGQERGHNPDVPSEVRQALFQLDQLGDVHSEVVSDGTLFYIVRLMSKSAARARTFAEAERSIRVRLLELKLRQAELGLEQELRKTIPVSIDQAALERVKAPAPKL